MTAPLGVGCHAAPPRTHPGTIDFATNMSPTLRQPNIGHGKIPSFANLCSFFKNVSCQPSPEAKPLGFPSLGKFRSFSKINGDVHAFYPTASRS